MANQLIAPADSSDGNAAWKYFDLLPNISNFVQEPKITLPENRPSQ